MAVRATTMFSLAEVKNWLDVSVVDQDSAIEKLADEASEEIEKYLRLPVVTRTVTERYDGTGWNTLKLRRFPVKSVTTLKIKEEQEGLFTTMGAADFDLFGAEDVKELKRGEIRMKSTASIVVFPSLRQNVEVTYVIGFGAQDSADLPAGIYTAGLKLAKLGWIQHRSDGIAASQISLGPGNYFFKADLPVEITSVLDRWVQPLVA